jgi:hypothetical protein
MKRFRTPLTIALGLVAFFGIAEPLRSVSVSPMAVYIDHRTRSGELTLFNPGTRTEEIRIDFAFGYPQTDENGAVFVPITEEAPAGEPSALSWLSAFPQRLRLEPGQRQVVRILARPPADLSPGEYWARARVHSSGGQPSIERREGEVGMQIELNTVIVVAVNYRNGEMSTGVVVDEARARFVGDSIVYEVQASRTGNAAFLGRLLIETIDYEGRVLASAEEVLPVYRTMRRRIAFPRPAEGFPTRARYTIDTERDDLPPGGVIPTEPVVREVFIR